MESEKRYILLDEFAEDIELYLAEKNCDIVVDDEEVINIYLDLPNTENYNYLVNKIEKIFSKTRWHIEDFEIEGDHEGHIEIIYVGE